MKVNAIIVRNCVSIRFGQPQCGFYNVFPNQDKRRPAMIL